MSPVLTVIQYLRNYTLWNCCLLLCDEQNVLCVPWTFNSLDFFSRVVSAVVFKGIAGDSALIAVSRSVVCVWAGKVSKATSEWFHSHLRRIRWWVCYRFRNITFSWIMLWCEYRRWSTLRSINPGLRLWYFKCWIAHRFRCFCDVYCKSKPYFVIAHIRNTDKFRSPYIHVEITSARMK